MVLAHIDAFEVTIVPFVEVLAEGRAVPAGGHGLCDPLQVIEQKLFRKSAVLRAGSASSPSSSFVAGFFTRVDSTRISLAVNVRAMPNRSTIS